MAVGPERGLRSEVRWDRLVPATLMGLGFFLGGLGLPRARAAELSSPAPRPFKNTEPGNPSPPVTPAEGARSFELPPGFSVSLFAGEPDVQNPIACCWDTRGRLWIAENYTYAERPTRFETGLRDRLVILEDADGDGRHDKRTVFSDDLQYLSSVEIAPGGVYVLAPPHLAFLPDKDGNDQPDGPAEVLLDGFEIATENYHTFANGLKWGPDGWLYGRCGASCPGEIGPPGTAKEARIPIRGGIWRYHPERRVFETLAHGTTNPWGMDWDEFGEAFFVNTVNGHLWHLIPGSHLQRPHSIEPSPWVFEPIDFHADHYHFDTGKGWNKVGADSPATDALGGGHAHIGCLIYQDNNWPLAWRGKLLTLNMHGRRINVERLEREGSGFIARHEPDLLKTSDPWFRGMELTSGPDGGVYLLDWSDTGECHEHTGVHRESGRLYKVTYTAPGAEPAVPLRREEYDLTKKPLRELFELALEADGWYGRMARRELQARKQSGANLNPSLAAIRESLEALLDPLNEFDLTPPANVRATLRAMWLLHGLSDEKVKRRNEPEARGPLHREAAIRGIADDAPPEGEHELDSAFDWLALYNLPDERIATWAIRLAVDHYPIDTIFGTRPAPGPQQSEMPLAVADDLAGQTAFAASGLIRLAYASAMQRMPHEARARAAIDLSTYVEDATDHNLPSLVWTALHPLAEEFPEDLQEVVAANTWGSLNRWIVRRFASEYDEYRPFLNPLLANVVRDRDVPFAREVVLGLSQGLAGRRKATKPADWDALIEAFEPGASPELASALRELNILFGDGRALDDVARLALDAKADLAQRQSALQTLIDFKAPELRSICEQLLTVRYLNTTALAGLASLSDPEVGVKLAKSYRSFHLGDRPAVIETLVARATFAKPLLDELAAGRIARSDLTPSQARQILRLGDEALSAQLRAVWGDLRDSTAEKQALVQSLKSRLTADVLAQADLGKGRALFNRTCASCHQLYGQGERVGPDLTGADRKTLDYLIDNIADPSATLAADFRMTVFELKDGRVVSGVVLSKTPQALVVRTQKEQLTIAPDEIDESQPTTLSLMPDGLLEGLSDADLRDLFGYLQHPVQVPVKE